MTDQKTKIDNDCEWCVFVAKGWEQGKYQGLSGIRQAIVIFGEDFTPMCQDHAVMAKLNED